MGKAQIVSIHLNELAHTEYARLCHPAYIKK
jgi:hypothetical protein